MARIGLFGGTFNPIHIGHLTIAEEARLRLGLDRVVFIPSGDPYLKDPAKLAPQADRLAMTRLAAITPGFEVSDLEIRREGPSYTSETVTEYRAGHPDDELYLILGADSLLEIERWRDPETIFQTVTVLAFTRGGVDSQALRETVARLQARYDARIELMDAFALNVSSSEIRDWVRTGHACRHLVTEPVYLYIQAHGLYRAGDPRANDAHA